MALVASTFLHVPPPEGSLAFATFRGLFPLSPATSKYALPNSVSQKLHFVEASFFRVPVGTQHKVQRLIQSLPIWNFLSGLLYSSVVTSPRNSFLPFQFTPFGTTTERSTRNPTTTSPVFGCLFFFLTLITEIRPSWSLRPPSKTYMRH